MAQNNTNSSKVKAGQAPHGVRATAGDTILVSFYAMSEVELNFYCPHHRAHTFCLRGPGVSDIEAAVGRLIPHVETIYLVHPVVLLALALPFYS